MYVFFLAACIQGAIQIPPAERPQAPSPGTVVARVNGEQLRASDVAPLLWDWHARETLQEIAGYMLIAQDARKKGIAVSDSEVEKALKDQLAGMGAGKGTSAVEATLREQGFTWSRLFLRKKAELLMERVVGSEFKPSEFVKVSTIAFKPASEQATEVSAAIAKADAAYEQLQGGQPWEKVLAGATTDARLLQSKGLLGWRQLDAFPQTVRKDLEALKVGHVTKPAQTQHGIQIFRLEAHGRSAQADELKSLKRTFVSGASQEYVNRLKSEAKIEILLPTGGKIKK